MRFYVNLTDGAVSLGLFDRQHMASGWVTKRGQNESVEVQFHRDSVPELLAAGVGMLWGCKPYLKFDNATYLTSVATPNFTVPGTAAGFYTAKLPTNTAPINTALGSPDGDPANDVAVIAQTTCEIQWWPDGPTALPRKSQTFSVRIENTPNNGNETDPETSTPVPAAAALQAAVAQAAAAEPDLGLPDDPGMVLKSTVDGHRYWDNAGGGVTSAAVVAAVAGQALNPASISTALVNVPDTLVVTSSVNGATLLLQANDRSGRLSTNANADGLSAANCNFTIQNSGPTLRFQAGNAAATYGALYASGAGNFALCSNGFAGGPADASLALGSLALSNGRGFTGSTFGIIAAGSFLPGTVYGSGSDATYDIGYPTLRYRDAYFSGIANVGSLAASGTITGKRVARGIEANATAVVTASGGVPADDMFLVHNNAGGTLTITIPSLALPVGSSREFVVIDAANSAGSNVIAVEVNDTGDSHYLENNGGKMSVTVTRTATDDYESFAHVTQSWVFYD